MTKLLEFSLILKTPGVCGGDARIRGTRVPVWVLEEARRLDYSDTVLLGEYPFLTGEQLSAVWQYVEDNSAEINDCISQNALACDEA